MDRKALGDLVAEPGFPLRFPDFQSQSHSQEGLSEEVSEATSSSYPWGARRRTIILIVRDEKLLGRRYLSKGKRLAQSYCEPGLKLTSDTQPHAPGRE